MIQAISKLSGVPAGFAFEYFMNELWHGSAAGAVDVSGKRWVCYQTFKFYYSPQDGHGFD
jgi:hypothetical protein